MIDLNSAHATYMKDGDIDALLSIIRTYVFRRSKDDDIAQSTSILIWKKLDQYDPARGSFAAWVSVICRNQIADAKRKSSKLIATEDERLEQGDVEPDRSTPEIITQLISDKTAPQVVELLLAGHSIKSIGKQLGLTHSQIIHRLGKIKKNISRGVSKNMSPGTYYS